VRAAVSTAVILRNFSNMTRLPRFLFGANPHLDWLSANSDVKQGTSLAKLGESIHAIALISRYGESEDRRDPVEQPHKRPLVHQRWRCPRGAGDWTIANDRPGRLCAACPGGARLCLGDSAEKPCKPMRPFFPKAIPYALDFVGFPPLRLGAPNRRIEPFLRSSALPSDDCSKQSGGCSTQRHRRRHCVPRRPCFVTSPFRVEADGCRLSTCRCDNRLNLRRCFVGILRPRPVVGQRGHHQDAGQNYDDRRIDGYQSS